MWLLYDFQEARLNCLGENIPFKILLLIDNATGHPPNLDDIYPDVRVKFMPPITTALIQPMDQGIIASFKTYHARPTIAQAVEATQGNGMTLGDYWKRYYNYSAIKMIVG